MAALGAEQTARLDAMATEAAPILVNTWSTGQAKTRENRPYQSETRKALSA